MVEGDWPSDRIEAHGATILGMLKETADITLGGRKLAEKALVFGDGTVRRFPRGHKITHKKRRRMSPNGS